MRGMNIPLERLLLHSIPKEIFASSIAELQASISQMQISYMMIH